MLLNPPTANSIHTHTFLGQYGKISVLISFFHIYDEHSAHIQLNTV